MHFITFPVSSTNIFPLVNSKNGGQLMSEFNIRSMGSVATDPNIQYFTGPSYTHSMNDFEVSLLSGMDAPTYNNTSTYNIGDYCTYNDITYVCIYPVETPEEFNKSKWNKVNISTSILQLSSGKAVINGHYFESLLPVTVDLTLANAQLKQASQPALSGELCVGLRAYYSTETTMAGSMLVENEDNMYLGVQVIILPKNEFITPSDSPTDRNAVTADIKLADFVYLNGSVSSASIKQNAEKISYLPAERIGNFDNVLSTNYISKTALDRNKLYVFSGLNGSDNNNGWCQANDSLMVWDKNPQTTTTPTVEGEAGFITDANQQVHLRIPHKQVHMTNTAGQDLYFKSKDIAIPVADYSTGTPGTVTSEYTQKIKDIGEVINTYKTFVNGKQILYLEQMDSDYKQNIMPTIDISTCNAGDYILVRQDFTAIMTEDEGAAPATMYVVLPGYVSNLTYRGIDKPSGVRLGLKDVVWSGDGPTNVDDFVGDGTTTTFELSVMPNIVVSVKVSNTLVDDYEIEDNHITFTTAPAADAAIVVSYITLTTENLLKYFDYTSFRGSAGDYFSMDYYNDLGQYVATYYWEASSDNNAKTWSGPINITGGIPYASNTAVGGFLNVTETDTDNGYVYRDETGHLRLLDYSLLRSGTLAYQLGQDYTLPKGLDAESIQALLEEYVNNRIAFPFVNSLGAVPNMINIYITLPTVETPTSINIYNIDSRFGTGVYLHFLGEATSNTVVNIIDCEKVRIDPNIEGSPVINVIRTNIFYDASVFNYIRKCDLSYLRSSAFTGFQDITIWYDKFEATDPDLLVCGMEVSQPNVPMTSQDIDFWSPQASSDNHYGVALRSITFNGQGDIVGCSLYVSNNTTLTNSMDPTIIGGEFIIPQGADLNYPDACITTALKVTGTFTTAYLSESDNMWIVSDTSFTALSGVYSAASGVSNGTISFYSKPAMIPPTYTNVNTIDGWIPGSYHIFYGGTTV